MKLGKHLVFETVSLCNFMTVSVSCGRNPLEFKRRQNRSFRETLAIQSAGEHQADGERVMIHVWPRGSPLYDFDRRNVANPVKEIEYIA